MISVQFYKQKNAIIDESLVKAAIVNMQTMEFEEWCEHMADGSTVTAADVAAVMKQVEKKLPLILAMNAKVICSPEGLTFRPKVSGTITQSELKKKLEARKAAEEDPEKAAKIDVNRVLTTSDLTVRDCNVSIEVDLPKFWSTNFMQRASLKRVRATGEENDDQESWNNGQTENTENPGGSGNNSNPTVTAPTISGTTPFEETTSVTMSGPAGAEIRYTVDGSTPTAESSLYSEALTLSETTTVKAIAIKDGVSSEVTTRTFTKGTSGGGLDD